MFRTYRKALDYLNRFTDYERMAAPPRGKQVRLDRMRKLVAALGHPEREFRSLHIAGTKGKGSVAIMAEALLRQAGFRTGLYTSPHLVHLLERIALNGSPILEADFLWAMNRMEPALRRLGPTFFETLTAAAFLVFARDRVDYAVIEVGLGGRLDATNVIHPVACAITPIDYDHMERLGHTLAEISSEKAGIIKPKVPVVVGPQRQEVLRVIRRRARPLRPRAWAVPGPGFMLQCTVEGLQSRRYRFGLRVLGEHQAANAATAIGLVEAAGVALRAGTVRGALERVRLPARVDLVARRPWWIVDGAHNPVSVRALVKALARVRRRRTILVFGASADKDYRRMLSLLGPLADIVILTRSLNPRAADPGELARYVRVPALLAPAVAPAVELARLLARPSDAIVVTGSFYVAGEALEALERHGLEQGHR